MLTDFETSPVPEVIGVFVAYAILAFTFASLLAAGLPILTAIVGVGIGHYGCVVRFPIRTDDIRQLPFWPLCLAWQSVLIMRSSLFHRHRQQLAEGLEIEESIGRAVGTAGSAVVFAGLTVIVALAGFSITGVPFLSIMGFSRFIYRSDCRVNRD